MHIEEEEWVKKSLCDAEKRRCVAEILSIDKKDVVAKGDNYTSELSRLRLKVVLYSGEVEERLVIYKCLPSTELRKKHMRETGLFVIEKRMYTEVLPLMENIRKEKESGEPLWGICYATNGYESMLLEDLSVHGYRMGQRMKGLDSDHCKLVMRSLAKFHSLAAVLIQRGDLIIKDYDQYFLERNVTLMGKFYEFSFQGLASTLEQQKDPEWKEYAARLRKKGETVVEDLLSILKVDKARFNTLNHGDCWVNNMLFKYSDDGKPISIRLIDFQVSFYNSVGFDLNYFLSTSTTEELRPKNMEFLQVYHDSLVEYLRKFGYEGVIPTFEDVLQDFNRVKLFGLTIATTLLPFMKIESKDVPDFEEALQEMEEKQTIDVVNMSNTMTDECIEALKYIIKDGLEHDIL